MEPLRIFDNFKLDDLDEKWIKSIWDSEFTVYKDLPDQYILFLESDDMGLLLKESSDVVKACLAEARFGEDPESRKSEISWHTLHVLNVNVHGLLAVLGYMLMAGQRARADEDSRQTCLGSASLYFVLLAIPGSNAFNVFHPNLYRTAIECLRMSTYLIPVLRKRKTEDMENLCNGEELVNEHHELSNTQKIRLTKGLNSIVSDFLLMTKTFWFKDHIRSLDDTINVLIDVTKIEADLQHLQIQWEEVQEKREIVPNLSNNAYIALQTLCDDKHGSVDMTIMLIVKYLLPRLLFSHNDLQLKTLQNAREASIHFLKNILSAREKEARDSIITLIQHLMVKCPERVEARQKQAMMLIKLLNICSLHIFLQAIENIILLAHHSRVTCRIFALEVIGRFLIESLVVNYELPDSMKTQIKRILVSMVLCRCTDCSCMVRGKAMAILAEITDSNSNVNSTVFQRVIESPSTDKLLPTFEELKNALSKGNNPLPGFNTVFSMLIDRVEDERALVRRSALQILKNLVVLQPSLIDTVRPLMTRCCRDPALTVRRFAIQLLSQTVERLPYDLSLLDEWVRAVMPQILDIEVKVQDKVLESLEDLLIKRITNISNYAHDEEGRLPWEIISKLTSWNMRKYLSRACNLWVKNGTVTKRLITNVQSHIGTDNNIAAWVLLSALAENMKLPNMNKYIIDCKEIIKRNDFYASLVLEVLRHTWCTFDKDELKELHTQLFEGLCTFEINFGIIGVCVDIVETITQYLESRGSDLPIESNMSDLLKMCEAEIEKIVNTDENEIETGSRYLNAVSTLGHVAFVCSNPISLPILRILEGLILDWESLPDIIKRIEELQPAAVVALGQQALRDRNIAQEVIPIFGRLMRQEVDQNSKKEAAIKINAAKTLADLCVRFTALVEPYLSDMCISMKDANTAVRETIVVIFIQLLLEDFIKVKGPFFFHILTMLTDPDNMIRELTVFLIEERLLVKNKVLVLQQFLQSIYHYNNYEHRHKLCNRKMQEREMKALTFPGKKNCRKRHVIYDFMLEHLDPPAKIKLIIKITDQILSRVYNDTINIKAEEGANVLKDALYIISNERLHPSSSCFSKHNEDPVEQEESAPQVNTQSNAINVIVEGIKKYNIEILLPLLVKLKTKLSLAKSALEEDVMKLLVKTYSEYNKDHLVNLLSEYSKLEEEIDHYRRKSGRELNTNEESGNEEAHLSSNTDIAMLEEHQTSRIDFNWSPRVVLHRLSPPISREISNWNDFAHVPRRISPSSRRSSRLSSVSINSVRGRNSSPEPGPSTSSPKPASSSYSPIIKNVSVVICNREIPPSYFQKLNGNSNFAHS